MAYLADKDEVIICTIGHLSREAAGNKRFTCKKIVNNKPCKKRAWAMDLDLTRAIYGRGWKARNTEIDYLSRYMGQWIEQMMESMQSVRS